MAFPEPRTDDPDTHVRGQHGWIAYRVWAPADPTRVVLLAHGYAEHSGRYDHLARALTDRGAAVYAPDHLGHGHSQGQRGQIDAVDDVVADLRTVAGRAAAAHPGLPHVVIGHSLGGLVAVRYVQAHPDAVRGLVLTSPILGAWPAATQLLDLEEIPDDAIDPELLSRDPAVGKAYVSDPLVYRGPMRHATLQAVADALDAAAADAEHVTVPVLYLHGADDALVPPEPSLSAVNALATPSLDARVLESARHEVLNEPERGEVIAAVAEFADRVTR